KGRSSSRKYTTSITKTKAAKYDNIEGIEDIVPMLWSLVKVAYDKKSTYDVFSKRRIIVVTHVKVMKWYDYRLVASLSQKKLSNLEKDVILDLNVALRISDINNMTLYTAYTNPQGIIYLDKYKRNRLMSSDKLYKFCDGTLTSVRKVLHDIANNLRMEYLPKRRWSNLDRKRSRIMIKAIDQQLFKMRLMRNLEKFVGGREYFRLLERAI
ncbi:hypothetical protein Tco_1389220, partial [Tanacetum coccineum]